jgi:hypothetical protein
MVVKIQLCYELMAEERRMRGIPRDFPVSTPFTSCRQVTSVAYPVVH